MPSILVLVSIRICWIQRLLDSSFGKSKNLINPKNPNTHNFRSQLTNQLTPNHEA